MLEILLYPKYLGHRNIYHWDIETNINQTLEMDNKI